MTRVGRAERPGGVAFLGTATGLVELAASRVVPGELAATLSRALDTPADYGWGYVKGCDFRPGVALSFERGERALVLLICFHDNELQVWQRDGQRVEGPRGLWATEDFERPLRIALVRAVKELFPEDARLQRLEEGRSSTDDE